MRVLLVCCLSALAMFLAGCTPAQNSATPAPETPSSTVAAAQPSVFDKQFHPCDVLTPEQLAEAGLGERIGVDTLTSDRFQSCSFDSPNSDSSLGVILIATDKQNRAGIEALDLAPVDWESSVIPQLYVHKMPGEDRQCTAAVDFEWGRFLVDYGELGEAVGERAFCPIPVGVLELLFQELGGPNGIES